MVLAVCSGLPDEPLKNVNYQDIRSEQCAADTVNKYHILLPANPGRGQKLPLVIALDVHGDGRLAVTKFQQAVQFFHCIVAGSDLIKNNFPGYETAIVQLILDIENKYPVEMQRIIIAGFSGGARMAYYFALEADIDQAYAQRSLTENIQWWKNELDALDKNLQTNTTGLKSGHYMRIKEFIGILLNSRINGMIYNDPGNPHLPDLLETYAYAEPENSEAWYFNALHAYQSGDQHSCIANLERSLKLGFTDINKMKSDFPKNILDQVNR